MSTVGDILSTVGVFSTVGGYHDTTLISKAATPFTCQVKTLQADARDSTNFSMIG